MHVAGQDVISNSNSHVDTTAGRLTSTEIDTIWLHVVELDRDTVLWTMNVRDSISKDLLNFSLSQQESVVTDTSVAGKAYLFSYFILLRNKDYTKIIKRFEKYSQVESRLWKMIYPIYIKSITNDGDDLDNLIPGLTEQVGVDPNAYHQMVFHNEIGRRLLYDRSIDEAQEYFENTVNIYRELDERSKLIEEEFNIASSYLQQIKLSVGESAVEFCALALGSN